MKKSEIKIEVVLDETSTPEKISWLAEGPQGETLRECKGMLLSFFDKETFDTFKIDLWTKEMQVSEMNRFMYYTLQSLSDTFYNSTNNAELANQMRSFVDHFGKATSILPANEE